MLAATIFGFLVVALIGAIIYGTDSTASAGDRVRAQFLAEEGAEAVRNIRDSGFANITDGTYGITQLNNTWVLSGTSDTTGKYTRQITITTIDTLRKSVDVTVTWPQGTSTAQIGLSTRLTNWFATIVPIITNGPTIMAYSKTTTEPFYRTWDGTAWGAEAAAQSVVGTINYIVVKSSNTRNESILGVQTSTGAIYIQIWDGTNWGNLTQVGTGSPSTRSFDIAYEKASGRAMITYTPNSGAVDFAYRTWNGTALSAPITITAPPTTGAISWLEIDRNPLSASNEVALILLDANNDVYGMLWNGTSWVTMGVATVWDATAANASKKAIAVKYEQQSGEPLFIWGDAVATDQYFRTWNGATLSAATLLDIPAAGGVAEWTELTSRPNSNEILYGVQDAGADLNTRKWSGSAWDTAAQHPEHSAAVETITSRTFDIIWETSPFNNGTAWIMWGNGTRVSTRAWNTTAWANSQTFNQSDDTAFVRLASDPISGAVFAGIYEDISSNSDDITEMQLTGGSATWSRPSILWGGPVSAGPVYFRVDIATP